MLKRRISVLTLFENNLILRLLFVNLDSNKLSNAEQQQQQKIHFNELDNARMQKYW